MKKICVFNYRERDISAEEVFFGDELAELHSTCVCNDAEVDKGGDENVYYKTNFYYHIVRHKDFFSTRNY